jgi:hypothetical protein
MFPSDVLAIKDLCFELKMLILIYVVEGEQAKLRADVLMHGKQRFMTADSAFDIEGGFGSLQCAYQTFNCNS